MIVHIDRATGIVTKTAETPAEVVRLRREAEILSDAPHPGVVELIGLEDPGELRLRTIDGPSLADCLSDGNGPWTAAEVLAFGAEVATTVADLHDIGVVHGQLTARHVVVGPGRRPVLCSLGHHAEGPEDDVAALGHLLRQLQSGVEASSEPGAARTLGQAVSSATEPDPARRPTARALARRLAEPAPPSRLLASGGPVWVATGVVVVLVVAALWIRPGSAASAGQFRVSERADAVAVGRWTCRTVLPAVLRPATGEIWVWDGSPPGRRRLTGRLAARVAGATSLRAVTTRRGCDTLLITRRTGPPVAIDP